MPGRAVLVTLAIATLAGCGVGDDREQARAVTERFYAALEADRGTDACGELAPAVIEAVESQSGQSCDAVITRLDWSPGAIASVEVFATNARVVLDTGEHAYLSRERTGWRLSAVGCEPEDGRPRDRPMSCEAEA